MFGSDGRRSSSRGRPGATALVLSLALHVAALATLWMTGLARRDPLPEFRVYRVNIVSPPPREAGPPVAVAPTVPQVVPPPREEPPPQPEPQPEPRREPRPEPAPEPVVREERPAEPKPEPKPAVVEEPKPAEPASPPRGARPEPDARTAGDGVDIRIEGEEFPFPDYLRNIQLQIARYFRWTGSTALEAEIYFVIRKDGTVEDIRVVRGSGDVSFNLNAVAAIEQAGRRQAFGPLPDGYAGSSLPVLFYFRPAR